VQLVIEDLCILEQFSLSFEALKKIFCWLGRGTTKVWLFLFLWVFPGVIPGQKWDLIMLGLRFLWDSRILVFLFDSKV